MERGIDLGLAWFSCSFGFLLQGSNREHVGKGLCLLQVKEVKR